MLQFKENFWFGLYGKNNLVFQLAFRGYIISVTIIPNYQINFAALKVLCFCLNCDILIVDIKPALISPL